MGMKPEIWKKKSRTFPSVVPRQGLTVCAASAWAGWRRHGDRYPDHLVLTAALRVEAGELSGGSHVLGKKTWLHGNVWWKLEDATIFPSARRLCLSPARSGPPSGGSSATSMAEELWVPLVLFHVDFLHVLMSELWKTGSDHFLVQRHVFWPADRLCSRVQLVVIPTVPRRLWLCWKSSRVCSYTHSRLIGHIGSITNTAVAGWRCTQNSSLSPGGDAPWHCWT